MIGRRHPLVVGALAAALALSACGRKGALEAPPDPAYELPPAAAGQAPPGPAAPPPPPERDGFFLDFLL